MSITPLPCPTGYPTIRKTSKTVDYYHRSFAHRLEKNEVISSIIGITFNPKDGDLRLLSKSIDLVRRDTVQMRLAGGIDQTVYTITISVLTEQTTGDQVAVNSKEEIVHLAIDNGTECKHIIPNRD